MFESGVAACFTILFKVTDVDFVVRNDLYFNLVCLATTERWNHLIPFRTQK